MTIVTLAEHNMSSMLDLHTRWKAAMQGLQDLLDPLDTMRADKPPAAEIEALTARREALELESKKLAAEIIAREPVSCEDRAILADLALTYDTNLGSPGEGVFDSPGAFGTTTHIGRLALALSKMAPHIKFWSIEHELMPKLRAELLTAAV